MVEKKRFIIDDCGTLIDIKTRNMFDYVEEVCPLLNDFYNENEKLKMSVFQKNDEEHYQKWIKEIKSYVKNDDFNYTDDFIIKLALSYTLQSLRNGESLKKFQWKYNKSENDCMENNCWLDKRVKKMEEPEYYNMNGLSPNRAFKKGLISKDEYIGFLKGNVIKYVVRCDKKGSLVSDINKAIDYLNLLKEVLCE